MLCLHPQDADVVQEWSAHIRAALRLQVHRPKNLLVIINPFGGARKALQIWETTVMPVFDLAGQLLDHIYLNLLLLRREDSR